MLEIMLCRWFNYACSAAFQDLLLNGWELERSWDAATEINEDASLLLVSCSNPTFDSFHFVLHSSVAVTGNKKLRDKCSMVVPCVFFHGDLS